MRISYMPYAIIAGVVLVALLAGFFIGWDDAWFVPLVVLPFVVMYALFDRRKRAATQQQER